MELIHVEAEIFSLILWDVLATHGGLLEFHDEDHTEEIGVNITQAPLREVNKEDFLIIHDFANIEAGFNLAARFADRILVVTGADPAAVRDAGRVGQLLELMGKKQVRIIVNRVNEKLYSTVKITVDDVMDRAGLPLLGIVPDDPAVTLAAALNAPASILVTLRSAMIAGTDTS